MLAKMKKIYRVVVNNDFTLFISYFNKLEESSFENDEVFIKIFIYSSKNEKYQYIIKIFEYYDKYNNLFSKYTPKIIGNTYYNNNIKILDKKFRQIIVNNWLKFDASIYTLDELIEIDEKHMEKNKQKIIDIDVFTYDIFDKHIKTWLYRIRPIKIKVKISTSIFLIRLLDKIKTFDSVTEYELQRMYKMKGSITSNKNLLLDNDDGLHCTISL